MHQLEGRVVAHQMVEQQLQQPAAVGRIFGDEAAQQGRLAYIQAVVARVVAGAELLGDLAVLGIQADFFDDDGCLSPDHLHRFGQAIPQHGGAQDVVAVDHRLQRSDEALQPLAAIEAH